MRMPPKEAKVSMFAFCNGDYYMIGSLEVGIRRGRPGPFSYTVVQAVYYGRVELNPSRQTFTDQASGSRCSRDALVQAPTK